ncbi:ROK family transcriptional regulator [Actinospica robiniae]|uniref:ROK family transcriptional regulator n=1 Tax=Actinospica robiniae TaxID=304901 RepID=UPI0004032080|nr:ROK family transcriptional regulator [Actinospica robiniae]
MRWGAGSISGDGTRTAVLALLARRGPLSRAEIAESLELSPATVTSSTRRLLAEGLIAEQEPRVTQSGRPSIPLRLIPWSAHAIGVQVALEHISLVLARLDGAVVDGSTWPFNPAAPKALDRLIGLIQAQMGQAARQRRPLLGVGVAVPGAVDPDSGTLRMSVRLGWNGMPLATKLRTALRVPVFVDNDISAVTVAERLYGPSADCADFLVVAIGQGIGLGLVLDGAPYRGAAGAAGEFGHLPILPDGTECACGNRGCLETQASTEALTRRAKEANLIPPQAGVSDLGALAAAGNPHARELFAEAGEMLGRALAGVVNILGTSTVVVVGEITQLWDHVQASFDSALAAHLLPYLRNTRIEVRPWDDRLIAVAAAGVALCAPLAAPRQR